MVTKNSREDQTMHKAEYHKTFVVISAEVKT